MSVTMTVLYMLFVALLMVAVALLARMMWTAILFRRFFPKSWKERQDRMNSHWDDRP